MTSSRSTPPLSRPEDLDLGRHTTVLVGARNGQYPSGNSVLVRGTDETVLIDPSLEVVDRGGAPASVDRIVLTHVHEDHVAGVHLFPDAGVESHEADLLGIHDLDGLMTIYAGDPEHVEPRLRRAVEEEFHYRARPDATGFADGATWDLGGVRITAIHLPGHTRGHCGLLVEPDGVLVLGDIDLSSFGPYYSDTWSSLADFEASIARAREVEARWYATFHHKGVFEGRDAYVPALDAFGAVIGTREEAMLAYLAEPRTLADLVAHRFVYRPGVDLPWVDRAEANAARQHLERLVADGRVAEIAPDTWRATGTG